MFVSMFSEVLFSVSFIDFSFTVSALFVVFVSSCVVSSWLGIVVFTSLYFDVSLVTSSRFGVVVFVSSCVLSSWLGIVVFTSSYFDISWVTSSLYWVFGFMVTITLSVLTISSEPKEVISAYSSNVSNSSLFTSGAIKLSVSVFESISITSIPDTCLQE